MTQLSVVFGPERRRAQSHRCTAAVLRHTKSLSNHFALLPRIHQGPVSVLAGYSALFISAPGSYLLSPGSQMKCIFPPKKGTSDCVCVFWVGIFFFLCLFSFIGALHRPFFFIPLTKHYLLGCLLCYTGKNPICAVLHGSVKTFCRLSRLSPAQSSSAVSSGGLSFKIFLFFPPKKYR